MNKKQELTACVFLHKDGKVLIAKRADSKVFLPGKYELVGGRLEFGETPEECLVREAMEEIHVKIKVGKLFHAFTYLSEDNTKHSIEVDYIAELENPNAEIKINPEDHSDYRWVSENELADYLPDNDLEAQAIRAGFKALKINNM